MRRSARSSRALWTPTSTDTERNPFVNITIDDIVSRYNAEIAKLTQRMILAEARADAAEARLAEQDDPEA